MSDKVAGVGYSSIRRGETPPHFEVARVKWRDMLHRCYDENQYGYIQYGAVGVVVCEQWHDFKQFAGWVTVQRNYGTKGFELDKDILIPDSRVYSPSTCCLVPRCINIAVTGQVKGSEYKTGVSSTNNPKKPFRARLSIRGKTRNIGVYAAEDEAHAAYNAVKRQYVRELAEEYRYSLDTAAYWRLSKWEPAYE